MKKENVEIKSHHLLNCHIAGFAYYEGTEVFDELTIGTKLRLVREKENGYDPCAIAIYHKNCKLGFIPSEYNEKLAIFLDLGYKKIFSVTINRVNPQEHPEKQIGVIVRLRPYSSLFSYSTRGIK